MEDNKSNLPAIKGVSEIQINSSMNIGLADIVTVAVAKAENHIKENLSVVTAEIKEIDSRVKDLRKIETDIIEKYIGDTYGAMASAAEQLIKVFDAKNEVEIKGSIQLDGGSYVINLTLSMSSRYGSGSAAKLPATEEMIAAHKAVESAIKEKEAKNEIAFDLRKKLAQVPSLERHYRGRLVEAQLEGHSEGQAILAHLTNDMDNVISRM